MKKALSVLALVALVAAVSTSCKKDCVCTQYKDGEKMVRTTTYENDHDGFFYDCDELEKQEGTWTAAGHEYEIKCK